MREKDIKYYMKKALELAKNSPDPSTQNGAVILQDLGKDSYEVLGLGWNDFRPGVKKRVEDREEKLNHIEHAERNAIWDFFRTVRDWEMDLSSIGPLILVCPWAACGACANALQGANIKTVIRFNEQENNKRSSWYKSIQAGDNIFNEAGIEIIEIENDGSYDVEILRSGKLKKF